MCGTARPRPRAAEGAPGGRRRRTPPAAPRSVDELAAVPLQQLCDASPAFAAYLSELPYADMLRADWGEDAGKVRAWAESEGVLGRFFPPQHGDEGLPPRQESRQVSLLMELGVAQGDAERDSPPSKEVAQLMELGVVRSRAERALHDAGGDVQRAALSLF